MFQVLEALINDKAYLSPQEWVDLVESKFNANILDAQLMRFFSRIPNLMQRGRYALNNPFVDEMTLMKLRLESESQRNDFQPVLEQLRDRLRSVSCGTDPLSNPRDPSRQMSLILHASYSRAYGMGITVGILLNLFTESLTADQIVQDYCRDENLYYAQETVVLAEEVKQYRPLGSMYMLLCLCIAHIATDDPDIQKASSNLLKDFNLDSSDYFIKGFAAKAEWMRRRFRLQDLDPDDNPLYSGV